MFKIHSITGRLFVSITVGVIYTFILFIIAWLLNLPVFNMLGLGMLLAFMLMGLSIGFVGTFDYHPILKFKIKWWILGIVGGTIFGLMFTFLTYNTMQEMLRTSIMSDFGFISPFWAISDFVLSGLLMGFFAKKFAGEGSSLPLK